LYPLPLNSNSKESLIRIQFDVQGGNGISDQFLNYGSVITEPTVPTKDGYFFLYWFNDFPEFAYDFSSLVYSPITLTAIWENFILTPAQFHINIDRSIDSVNKEIYVDGVMQVKETQKPWLFTELALELRGRGNGSSWGYEQKGYRLKLKEKVSFFGEQASRHWVLIPGGHDFGIIRNHAAFTISKSVMKGIPYTSSSRYVEVFINDQYHGLYNLSEHVRVDKGRIDIDSHYGILDTGYLIELDSYASGIEGIDYFWIQGIRYPFSVKSPEPDEWYGVISEIQFRSQIQFIQSYLQGAVNAVYLGSEKVILDYFDLDSLIDMYILHELFKNTDSGWSSFFLYKPSGGKFYYAPPWDFDFSAGISRGDSSTEGIYVGDTIQYLSGLTSSELFIALMQQSWFVTLTKSRYIELSYDIEGVISQLNQIKETNRDALERNSNRWYWYVNWEFEQDSFILWLDNRNH
jgi:hypothetical protein